mmetsp:Transcript_19909/g.34261  ORF Transcript_19909/g.34261 Transcript_19909/m.34261 type:complete len:203 (+) Transcript_19909:1392-2000(+)
MGEICMRRGRFLVGFLPRSALLHVAQRRSERLLHTFFLRPLQLLFPVGRVTLRHVPLPVGPVRRRGRPTPWALAPRGRPGDVFLPFLRLLLGTVRACLAVAEVVGAFLRCIRSEVWMKSALPASKEMLVESREAKAGVGRCLFHTQLLANLSPLLPFHYLLVAAARNDMLGQGPEVEFFATDDGHLGWDGALVFLGHALGHD